ncbi:MAG: uroporphyrinogen decarboxylase [Burkholderiales bacterium]|nr:uroporphyrinogen decarboxylase [Burkholderiales bacterium]
MSPLENDTLLRALAREPTEYTPVWLMRQAGRYLPEYRRTRARAGSFTALMRSPELCVEVALQPLERYPLDAAIVFSDILAVPDAMGLGLSFAEGEGPRLAHPVRDEQAVARLSLPDLSALEYVLQAVRKTRRALAGRVPLIGFAGSPYTLACYMVEGAASDEFPTVKRMLYSRPDLLHRILEVNAAAVADLLNAQIEAGAQVVMLFDTWGGNLSAHGYETFSLAYSRKVFASLVREAEGRRVPVILFTRGGGSWLEAMAESGCDAVGLDWTVDPRDARRRIGARVALQGNLDPAALLAPPECARSEARRVLEAFGPAAGHVFNLGHGIGPKADPDSVAAVVDEVRTYSRKIRAAR